MHWWKRVDFLKILILTFSICLFLSPGSSAQSVLAKGEWFKIAVTRTGVHRIDNTFLRAMGIEPSQLVPDQIQVFGAEPGMLPQANAAARSGNLVECAIVVDGSEDGQFDNADAIYFYAESPHVIGYDSVHASLYHQLNYYSDTSYYFLTFGQKTGLRLKNAAQPATPGAMVNQFDDFWFHELESANLLKSGREWWGEYLSGAPTVIEADISHVVPSSEIRFRGSAIGVAQVSTRFTWQLNGETLGESTIGTVGAGTYDVKALRADFTRTYKLPAVVPASFKIGVTHVKNGQGSAQGYLNYVSMQFKRELRFFDKQQLYYFPAQVGSGFTYQFAGSPAGYHLWNVDDPARPLAVSNQGTSGSFLFNASGAGSLRRYISFKPEQTYVPAAWQRIQNQDITSIEAPDLLIVTPAAWAAEAQRLAAFRTNRNGLKTEVVTTQQIYHEYAGGKPDITAIRDFVKHLYGKGAGRLRYLLLFGDATFDYRNLAKNQSQEQRNNWVPVYESRESLNPVYTYSSDDYYGFLEESEGEWTESAAGDHSLDIGVGRLPVKTKAEAKVVVDKLIRYETIRKDGSWKNKVQFVADDGDGNIHQRHADQLANLIQKDLFPERVFIDEFPQTTTDQGQKAPEVNRRIRNAIDNGTLIVNYTGHGGVSGWAEEQVLTFSDMLSARGADNLPLLFTATCDFGRYDDPGAVSGAETMVLSPKGAAIGAISTTRPVFSSTNFTLSKAFYEALIRPGEGRLMGDLFRETKNKALVGSLNRNFTLLGDPSMRLGAGQKGVRWAQAPDTLRALQKVRLSGEIIDKTTCQKDPGFTGQARVTIYDKPIPFETLGNEADPETYSEFRSKLFDGSVTVNNGVFNCEFIVPKDIDYRVGFGQASVYAVRADSSADAAGQLPVIVGGSGPVATDNTPPQLKGYLNNESFKDGDQVSPSPLLVARVSDENGVSLSKTGIGHNITLTINDTLTVILNDYFAADLDNYRAGTIKYPFNNLPAGKYNVRLKVWDTYTNFSEIAFAFQVVKPGGIKLNAINVFPNPFESDLSLELDHNRPNEDVELILNILLTTGQRIKTFKWQYYNSDANISQSLDAHQLGNGISANISLVYQLLIRSLKDSTFDQKSGRLIRSR